MNIIVCFSFYVRIWVLSLGQMANQWFHWRNK